MHSLQPTCSCIRSDGSLPLEESKGVEPKNERTAHQSKIGAIFSAAARFFSGMFLGETRLFPSKGISVVPSATINTTPVSPAAEPSETSEIRRLNEELFTEIFKRIEHDIKPEPFHVIEVNGDPAKFKLWLEMALLETSDRETKTVVRNILSEAAVMPNLRENILGCTTWDDMTLFPNLTDAIKHTSTELGSFYMKGLVGSPTTDIPTLRHRQALIQNLGSSGVADQMFSLLNTRDVREGERHLLKMWSSKNDLPAAVTSMFYRCHERVNRIGNSSPLALEVGIDCDRAEQVVFTGARVASVVAAFLDGACRIMRGTAPAPVTALTNNLIGFNGPGFAIALLIPLAFVRIPTTLTASLNCVNLKVQCDWTRANLSADIVLHKKLLLVASYYRAMKNIYEKLLSHPELTQHLSHFQKLKDFFHNERLALMFKVLEGRTFDGEAGWFFRRGNVYYVLGQLCKEEVRNLFAPALVAMGEIDTFVSAAKLMKEFREKRVTFCLPQYLEGSHSPELIAKNFWNVFVKPETVEANSVSCVESSPVRCNIITGPYGGGKTTVLRSIVEAIILGQSLGIAPADQLAFTPFSFVASSMNVSDLQGQKSHFQAECDRIAEIRKRLNNLKSTEFGIVVLDELFSGAAHKERGALETTETEALGHRNNVLSMVVSHDKSLSRLEKPGNAFKNYQLLVNDLAIPLFQLREGISNRHTAFQVARQRGMSEEQIQKAERLLEARKKGRKRSHR